MVLTPVNHCPFKHNQGVNLSRRVLGVIWHITTSKVTSDNNNKKHLMLKSLDGGMLLCCVRSVILQNDYPRHTYLWSELSMCSCVFQPCVQPPQCSAVLAGMTNAIKDHVFVMNSASLTAVLITFKHAFYVRQNIHSII